MKKRLLVLAVLTAPLAATAQTGERAPGHVAARAFAAAPAPLAFAVEPGDNTDENMALAQRIAKEAAARNMRVERGQSVVVLRFDTEVRTNTRVPGQASGAGRESSGFADVDPGRPPPPEMGSRVTREESACGDAYARCLRYVINATLEERPSGRRLWQGHVSYDTSVVDRTTMFVALAPALVAQIGKNVQETPFRLD